MSKQVFEVESAKVFLDVILGVIIGLPLSNFPEMLNEFGLAPSLRALTNILLLSSAITFCAFYWLEVRHFIEEQKSFNEAVSRLSGKRLEGIEFSVGRLLWSLISIVLAAAILKFAEKIYSAHFLQQMPFSGCWIFYRMYRATKRIKLRKISLTWYKGVSPTSIVPTSGATGLLSFTWTGL